MINSNNPSTVALALFLLLGCISVWRATKTVRRLSSTTTATEYQWDPTLTARFRDPLMTVPADVAIATAELTGVPTMAPVKPSALAPKTQEATTVQTNMPTPFKQPALAPAETEEQMYSAAESRECDASIEQYLQCQEGLNPKMILLLKWNSNGTLEHDRLRISEQLHPQWADEPFLQSIRRVPASPDGQVALLFNDDYLPMIDWSIVPPVPLFAWTVPNHRTDNTFVLPTPYDTGGYNHWCLNFFLKGAEDRAFEDRINKVLWRGAIHVAEVEYSRATVLEMAKNNSDDTSKWLNAATGQESEMKYPDMAEYRYHLDLGGLSGTSWGGTRWKMCIGALLLKVDTWSQDWWHDSIVPWTHFIPIKDDLSDLHQHWQWAEDHPEEAKKIAMAGQVVCKSTFEKPYMANYTQSILDSLPTPSKSIVDEADSILNSVPVDTIDTPDQSRRLQRQHKTENLRNA